MSSNETPAQNSAQAAGNTETDATREDYYTDRAPAEEHRMRADFARAHQLEEAYQSDPSEENESLHWDANEIDDRWSTHADEAVRYRWEHLNDCVHDWRHAPDTMRRFHEQMEWDQAQGHAPIDAEEWRNLQQARELTGHGQWPTETESGPARAELANAFAVIAKAQEQGMSR